MNTPPPASTPRLAGTPWPVYPKLIGVALLLGGFVCTLALILATPRETLDDWVPFVDAVGTLFKLVIVPASFVVVVSSLILFWRSRSWFLRQRWALVKVMLIVVTLPALHLWARSVFTSIRQELASGGEAPEALAGLLHRFTLLVTLALAVVLIALWLARYRPRLGQQP